MALGETAELPRNGPAFGPNQGNIAFLPPKSMVCGPIACHEGFRNPWPDPSLHPHVRLSLCVVAPLKIAFLINTYPRASHSFIRREVQALERTGIAVHRFAMRSDRAGLKDPADLAEDDRTEHVLAQPKAALLRGAFAVMLARPGQALSALRLALRLGRAGQCARASSGLSGRGGVYRRALSGR